MKSQWVHVGRRYRSLGFTLVELLVVIIIVAVLASLIFPVMQRAKGAAKSSSCVATIRELALATHLYLDDHDQHFPPLIVGVEAHEQETDATFYDVLKPYAQSFLRCPDLPVHSDVKPSLNTGYCFNSDLNLSVRSLATGTYYFSPYKLSDVTFPTSTVMLPECRTGMIGLGAGDNNFIDYSVSSIMKKYSQEDGIGRSRHNGGGNIAFVDAHAKWFPENGYPRGLVQADHAGFNIGLPTLKAE